VRERERERERNQLGLTAVYFIKVKKRTKRLSEFFQSYEPYSNKIGEVQDVLVTEVSHDGKHYVGHNKFYEQVTNLNTVLQSLVVAVSV
jgi:tRNA A37 methylthiotransferase MiaB